MQCLKIRKLWYDEKVREVQNEKGARVLSPELSVANRFAEKSAADFERANLHQNPELKVAASQVFTNGIGMRETDATDHRTLTRSVKGETNEK